MSYQDDDNRGAPPPLPADRTEYDDQDRYAPPAPQQGCSKGCIYVMAGCGCLTFLFLIGLVVLLVNLPGWVKQNSDPVAVTATTKEIADLDPPAGLKPRFRANVFFAKNVIYSSDDGESVMFMVQMDRNWQPKDGDKKAEPEFQMDPQAPRRRALEIVKSEMREMKVRGQDAKITFAEAKDPSNGKKYRITSGTFQGKGGPVEFYLQIPEAEFKEEDAVKFLESIK